MCMCTSCLLPHCWKTAAGRPAFTTWNDRRCSDTVMESTILRNWYYRHYQSVGWQAVLARPVTWSAAWICTRPIKARLTLANRCYEGDLTQHPFGVAWHTQRYARLLETAKILRKAWGTFNILCYLFTAEITVRLQMIGACTYACCTKLLRVHSLRTDGHSYEDTDGVAEDIMALAGFQQGDVREHVQYGVTFYPFT